MPLVAHHQAHGRVRARELRRTAAQALVADDQHLVLPALDEALHLAPPVALHGKYANRAAAHPLAELALPVHHERQGAHDEHLFDRALRHRGKVAALP